MDWTTRFTSHWRGLRAALRPSVRSAGPVPNTPAAPTRRKAAVGVEIYDARRLEDWRPMPLGPRRS